MMCDDVTCDSVIPTVIALENNLNGPLDWRLGCNFVTMDCSSWKVLIGGGVCVENRLDESVDISLKGKDVWYSEC